MSAARKATRRPRGRTEHLPEIGYSEDTADRIRAFLSSVRPKRDAGDYPADVFEDVRPLIERVALSARGEGPPTARLSLAQCADVLELFTMMEPIDAEHWWEDPKGSPSHLCGFLFVLDTLIASLRKGAQP